MTPPVDQLGRQLRRDQLTAQAARRARAARRATRRRAIHPPPAIRRPA